MAMNGIKLPLTVLHRIGVRMVQLYRKVGLTEQILDYFSGLVFLALAMYGKY